MTVIRVKYQHMNYYGYDQHAYPKGLEYWGTWWPTFVIVPGDLWYRASIDSDVTMTIDDGAVGMNTVVGSDGRPTITRGYNYDAKGVLAWTRRTLSRIE